MENQYYQRARANPTPQSLYQLFLMDPEAAMLLIEQTPKLKYFHDYHGFCMERKNLKFLQFLLDSPLALSLHENDFVRGTDSQGARIYGRSSRIYTEEWPEAFQALFASASKMAPPIREAFCKDIATALDQVHDQAEQMSILQQISAGNISLERGQKEALVPWSFLISYSWSKGPQFMDAFLDLFITDPLPSGCSFDLLGKFLSHDGPVADYIPVLQGKGPGIFEAWSAEELEGAHARAHSHEDPSTVLREMVAKAERYMLSQKVQQHSAASRPKTL